MRISEASFVAEKAKALSLDESIQNRENLFITAIKLQDGGYHALSRYGDDTWKLPSSLFPINTPDSKKILNFTRLPHTFQTISKQLLLRYTLNGLEGRVKPRGSSICNLINDIRPFLSFLELRGIHRLDQVTQLLCANYVDNQRNCISSHTGRRVESSMLKKHFMAVEVFHALSQQGVDVMAHPWPDASANILSGIYKKEKHKAKTLIIPETILSTLFGEAVKRLEKAEELLQSPEGGALLRRTSSSQQHYDIRDACMIIILTTSGIRVHELASIKTGGCYTVQSNSNERYYWMQGRSEKTYEGDTEWLVCNMTYRALQIAEEIAFPLQETLSEQIKKHEKILLNSMEAQELRRYQKALFLGKSSQKTDEIKPLSNANILYRINQFAQRHDIDWHFTPHQFRRTFANYAARSAYGDLRYLRDHFKHWSLDMTILYAMNEQQDVELYDEIMVAIKNEKIAIVEHWLEEDTLLAGGMAGQVRSFRSKTEAVRTYNTRVQLAEQISQQVHIRATTVAWCTADNTDCSGRGVADNTRCGECNNAIIDDRKKAVWVGIHNQQLELRDVDDIGEPGRLRVERDIKRCELVLKQLNVNVENRNPVKA